jgi:hypothetical protein
MAKDVQTIPATVKKLFGLGWLRAELFYGCVSEHGDVSYAVMDVLRGKKQQNTTAKIFGWNKEKTNHSHGKSVGIVVDLA